MANKKFRVGMLVIVLALGITVVGCGGTFTLTGIPSQYNGKYALFAGGSLTGVGVGGWQSMNERTSEATLPRISNGRVIIPLWKASADGKKAVRYSGNDTLVFMVSISDSDKLQGVDSAKLNPNGFKDAKGGIMFLSVKFSGGSAAQSWNDGLDYGGFSLEGLLQGLQF